MIQFIPKGPQIPQAIQKALMQDKLVLFCGAGISHHQNGLPLFKGLIEQLCKKLNVDIDKKPPLKTTYERKDYAGVLDLLEKLFDPKILRKHVIKILKNFKGEPHIHKDLLELSALPDGRGHRLVTTNFDRLFFEAGLDTKQVDLAPYLTPPRKSKWTHLTFLHGVIDEKNDSTGSNLILTSSDFDSAYFEESWATPFIFQLFQEFTVLFVGYGVNDSVMNFLMSRIRDKKERQSLILSLQEKQRDMPSIYAFAGYKEGNQKEKEGKWTKLRIEPIPYIIKEIEGVNSKEEDHSLLYKTIEKWAFKKKLERQKQKENDRENADQKKEERLVEYSLKINLPLKKTYDKYEIIQKLADLKKLSFAEQKSFLKEKLETPFKEDTDGEKAETVISLLKTNKRLAEYFPKINLLTETLAKAKKNNNKAQAKKSSPDGNIKPRPVDISWLKAFDKNQEQSTSNKNAPFFFDEKPKNSLLIKLTRPSNNLWEPLSHFERNIALWLCRHLNKADLIHALIETGALLNNLITLHPEFKRMIDSTLKRANLDERKQLFWQILTTQKDSLPDIYWRRWAIIDNLNKKYSLPQAKGLLESLEPKIGFEKDFYQALGKTSSPDKIYEAKLIIPKSYPDNRRLTNETALLSHAEDFTSLLKRAMELAEYAGIIKKAQEDALYRQRPSIAEHAQNTRFYPWTLLIVLARDSFDKAMQENKKLALSLLERWKLYPYSVFYRLILYAVTKYKTLDEAIAFELLANNKANVLWSISCQNEVLRYLGRQGRHSKQAVKKLVSLIMEGPPRSLYRDDLNETEFIELKERSIYKKLNCLKMAGAPQK